MAPSGYGWTFYRGLLMELLLLTTTTRALPAPRLAGSPFPVSSLGPPSTITVLNLTGTSFDERVLAMSAVGVVAQARADLATVDADDSAGPGSASSDGVAAWHLSLLPAELDYSLQYDMAAVLKRFATNTTIKGYVMCSGDHGPGDDNGSLHAAVSLAGILGGVVVTPSTVGIAQAAGITVELADTRTSTLEEVYDTYESQFSTTILFNQQAANMAHTTDFAIFSRAFALYDSELTLPLAQRALERLDNISMVLGWASEVDFVTSTSRHGHQVLCSDSNTNNPVYMNFAPPRSAEARRRSALAMEPESTECSVDASDEKHTVAFMFTDGDSITWDLGNFVHPNYDWWSSDSRGKVPIAWTFQPALQELHPYFLDWVLSSASPNDRLLVGPSGAGYSYLDQYPSSEARQRFANWTADNVARVQSLTPPGSRPMLNMINQIQVGNYTDAIEAEVVADPEAAPTAVLVDEYEALTIKGDAWYISLVDGTERSNTVVTSRRHCLSTTFGDVTPDQLVETLNSSPTNPTSTDGYSVIGVEVWSYGVSDIAGIVERLDPTKTRVVSIDEYFACLKQNALG